MDYWVLGFLWGNGRISGNRFLIQTKRKDLLYRVQTVLDSNRRIWKVERDIGNSWRMTVQLDHPYYIWLVENGYEGRIGNIERSIPNLNIDDELEFFKGYFSVHFTHDVFQIKKRHVTRLRFYASMSILEKLNEHLYSEVGTTLKKIQKHGYSKVCHILYYTSKREVPTIIEYLGLNNVEEFKEDDIVEIQCLSSKCDNTFLPKFHRHRFCSKRCQDNTYKRRKYAETKG